MVIVTKGSTSVIMEVMIRIRILGILNISADTLLFIFGEIDELLYHLSHFDSVTPRGFRPPSGYS